MRVTVTGRIERPVDEVFDFVADMRNDVRWAPLVEGVEPVEGDDPGAAAAYVVQQRFGKQVRPITFRVEAYERPRRLVWTMQRRAFDYRSTMDFEARGGATWLRQTNQYAWKAAPLAVRLFMRIGGRRVLRRQMRLLRDVLERQG